MLQNNIADWSILHPMFAQKKRFLSFINVYVPYLFLITILLIFCREMFTKGYILGGFDFEVGFLYPWKDTIWSTQDLANAARHYKNYLVSDSVGVILPIKLYFIDAIKQGVLPLWNPYILNGTSLIGNIQAAVMYPLNVLYFIASYPIAYTMYVLAQIMLAYIFMYKFLHKVGFRRLIATFGALSFSFSAYIMVWLTLGTIGHAYLWIPCVLWCFEAYIDSKRARYFIGMVAGLTFSLFAGHIQTALFVYMVFTIWVMCTWITMRKPRLLGTYFLTILISTGLSAIVLIPAIETYTQSVRGFITSETFFRSESLALTSYIQAIIPDFFGHPVTRNWWGKINYAESAIYFGTIPFLLFLYSLSGFHIQKKQRVFIAAFIIMLVGLVLSLENIVSYTLFTLKIPIISSSTFARFSSIYIFGALILSCFGFAQLLQDIRKQNTARVTRFFGGLAVLLVVYWLLLISKTMPAIFREHIASILRNSILPSGFIVGLLITIAVGMAAYKTSRQKKYNLQLLLGLAVLLLTSIELIRFGNKYTPFSPKEFFYPEHPVIEKLHTLTKNDGLRYYDYLPTNANAVFQIPSSGGNDPLYNQYAGELAMQGNVLYAKPTDRGSMQFPDGPNKQKILNLFSAAYYPDRENNFRNSWVNKNGGEQALFDEEFDLVWEENLYQIYKNKNALPRAYVAHSIKREDDKETIFKNLTSNEFQATQSAFISFAGENSESVGTASVINKKIAAQELAFTVTTDKPGLFVLTDTFYPGWKALINGEEVEILRTNWAFRGINVPEGTSDVAFVYDSHTIKCGALVSLTSLGILIGYGLYLRRKNL